MSTIRPGNRAHEAAMTWTVAIAAAVLAAPPILAQSTQKADTVEIRAAAAAFALPQKVRTGGYARIVADTAWAPVYNPDSVMVARGPFAIGHAVRLRVIRVERRAGRWVAVRVDPTVQP